MTSRAEELERMLDLALGLENAGSGRPGVHAAAAAPARLSGIPDA